jgi:hypothetical protein
MADQWGRCRRAGVASAFFRQLTAEVLAFIGKTTRARVVESAALGLIDRVASIAPRSLRAAAWPSPRFTAARVGVADQKAKAKPKTPS